MKYLVSILSLIFLFSCFAKTPNFKIHTKAHIYQKGISTWYGPGFNGRKTASGQIYDMFSLSAAHRTLPLGSIVRVTNIKNNKNVVVLINDRGPVNKKLILDLSKTAAKKLNIIHKGSAKVKIEILSSSKNPLKKIFDTFKNLGNN
jgi:rare lipoprotein A